MPIYGERTRRKLHNDNKGTTGTIVYLCDWADVDPAPLTDSLLPVVGDPWVDPGGMPQSYLRCVSVDADEGNGFECEYTAQYSTEGRRGSEHEEAYCEWSLDLSMEPGPDDTGWRWLTGRNYVKDKVAFQVPVALLTGKVRRDMPPYDAVVSCMGKVNNAEFQGFAKGCVLFLGASADNSIDAEGNILSSGVIYKFSIKRSRATTGEDAHNYFWRPPEQKLDAQNNPLTWHTDELEAKYHIPLLDLDPVAYPDYTDAMHTALGTIIARDHPQSGDPVTLNQFCGDSKAAADLTNPAGIGGWDMMVDTAEAPYYEEADFTTDLDIPEPS